MEKAEDLTRKPEELMNIPPNFLKRAYNLFIVPASHLDLFWTGTFYECLDKGADIIKRAIDLCRENDDYSFTIETVIFVKNFLKKYPQYKDDLLGLIRERRIEIAAAYVDRLENTTGGESLIRHILVGKTWARKNLNFDPIFSYHPDNPGVTPQMPQILEKTGVKYACHGRGGSRTGGAFRWKAPDGSSVLGYFGPFIWINPFYAPAYPLDLDRIYEFVGITLQKVGETHLAGDIMVRVYPGIDLGFPISEILDISRKFNRRFDNPKMILTIPSVFFEKIDKEKVSEATGEIPSVWGLYGYPNRPKIFLLDIEAENLILAAEKLSSFSSVMGLSDYPSEMITKAWEYHLICQDHNYGGAHGDVSDAWKMERRKGIIEDMCKVVTNAAQKISSNINFKDERPLVVFNTLPWTRADIVIAELSFRDHPVAGFELLDPEKGTIDYQLIEAVRTEGNRFQRAKIAFVARDVPSLGYKTFYIREANNPRPEDKTISYTCGESKWKIENQFFKTVIDEKTGHIESIFNKRLNFEIVGSGEDAFGQVVILGERGNDVAEKLTGRKWKLEGPAEVKLKENGSIRAVITITKPFFKSKIMHEITLFKEIERYDIKTSLFWEKRRDKQVRLSFPFSIKEPTIHYGCPFSAVKFPDLLTIAHGPTLRDEVNTEKWKKYRYIDKWIDVYNPDTHMGVTFALQPPAVCFEGSTIYSVLLRTVRSCGSPAFVWYTNEGEHSWSFSIKPHKEDWKESGAYKLGWESRNPLITIMPDKKGGILPEKQAFCKVEPSNIIVTTIKKCEMDNSVIIRYYETEGRPCNVKLQTAFAFKDPCIVNMLEEIQEKISVKGQELTVKTSAWEIKTLKITPTIVLS